MVSAVHRALLLIALAACGGSAGGVPVAPQPPAEPSHLVVLDQPGSGQARRTLGVLRVAAMDRNGQVMRGSTTPVRLLLDHGPSGSTLAGTTVAQPVDGVATFANLSVGLGGIHVLRAEAEGFRETVLAPIHVAPDRLHLVLLVADGWGYEQIDAAERYRGQAAAFAGWDGAAMSTFDTGTALAHGGVGYDPLRAWSEFGYLTVRATDSAASATAMYAGVKTRNGRIAVDSTGTVRLQVLAEHAAAAGLGIGAITSVPVSHATPAAWLAHNAARANYYAIADEMLWGEPNTTGTPEIDPRYGGGFGPSPWPAQVLLGGGHPTWGGAIWMRPAVRDKLFAEQGLPGAWRLVERIAGSPDAAVRLLAAAQDPSTARLAGLFGDADGTLGRRRADGSGNDPENPTLAELARAALAVLGRDPQGFALVVEGGAIDWAGHANEMDRMIGELVDFDLAVAAVIDWVEDPTNGSDWQNTVVVVTGDHETGLLTARPGAFPDAPLGEVSGRTIALERLLAGSGRRASWEDDGNGVIDPGEVVYWAWNTGGHSNILVPLFARGRATGQLLGRATGRDPVRGAYLDNVEVGEFLLQVLRAPR